MLAYHNDQKIKSKYVRRVEAHRKADELHQGVTWESNGVTRGCAVGCTFDGYDHKRGPIEIGVPEVLMRLEDAIFEGLPKADAMQWPTAFLKAIPVGADLSRVHYEFCAWLMLESGLLTITDGNRKAILNAGHLNRRAALNDPPTSVQWSSARSAAQSVARSAQSAALSAESAVWSAVWAADRSAARSSWSAARSAQSAALSAESAESAWSAAWKTMAAKLIELLETRKAGDE